MAHPRGTAGGGTQGLSAALEVRAGEFIATDSLEFKGLLLCEAVGGLEEPRTVPSAPVSSPRNICLAATHILCEDVNLW